MVIQLFDQVAFAEEVFAFAAENRLSVPEILKTAGCSPATIYRARKGIGNMKLTTAQRIEDTMLELAFDDIL